MLFDKSKPDLIITKKKALSIEPCDNRMQPVFFECPFQDRHSGLAFFLFGRNILEKYEKSIRTELYLMPNYFKKVIDEETVETDSGDSYFGLEVTIEM